MVKIITDTTSCLSPEFACQHQIPVIPQVINFGTDSYLEGVNLDNPTFIKKLKSAAELPKTAAPPVELFIKEFERLVPLGEPILCIHPSTDVSGTVRSAQTAAAEFPGADIRVIDTRLVATPLGTLVELATGWAEAGESADVIEQRLLSYSSRCRIYFLVATMEYLQRGGRIGGATALLGGLLQIKPILIFKDGHVDQFERARTMRHAISRLKELAVSQISKKSESYLSILHGDAPEQANELAKDLRSELELDEIPVRDMPPAIVTHAGPGVLGVAFFLPQGG